MEQTGVPKPDRNKTKSINPNSTKMVQFLGGVFAWFILNTLISFALLFLLVELYLGIGNILASIAPILETDDSYFYAISPLISGIINIIFVFFIYKTRPWFALGFGTIWGINTFVWLLLWAGTGRIYFVIRMGFPICLCPLLLE